MYLHCHENGESRNVVMASYDTGLSTVDDVKKRKDQSQSSSSSDCEEPCLASDTVAACVSTVVQGAVLCNVVVCAGRDVTADTPPPPLTVYTAYEDAI